MKKIYLSILLVLVGILACDSIIAQPLEIPREQVLKAMRKASSFYYENVATNDGYVYYYSTDLQTRWGEGPATKSQIWVQPPGTPTVGMAFLKAYEATGDRFYLKAAQDAAKALIYGQLKSGGWQNVIDFDPNGRVNLYRNGRGGGKNYSSLDDGQTQSAIRLLVHVDKALKFSHPAIHEAAQYALKALLNAQFDNGGFPQVWNGPVSEQKVLSASYPPYDWKTEGRVKNYWDLYTLNDNVCGYTAETLMDAYHIYDNERFLTALKKLGDFLLLAQMPAPQPGWAQQYNYAMYPAWARKFEPPAIASDETQETIFTLMDICRVTKDKKYLQPIPRAMVYLKRSQLEDGSLARFYELKTNRPLYMVRQGETYTLTYDDSDLPDHYGWIIRSRLEEIKQAYDALNQGVVNSDKKRPGIRKVYDVLKSLDDQGRWISRYQGEGLVGQSKFKLNEPYISSAVFSENIELLSQYLMTEDRGN